MINAKLKVIIGFLVFAVLLNFETKAQTTDHLKVPGPVNFHGEEFHLSWSSHPSYTYYKQEYVRKGEKVESFNEMVLLEFLAGNATPKGMVAQKVQELEKRKQTDPLVNFEVIESPDGKEFILDFIMSSGPAENLEIAEWNAYRYKSVKDASGKKGVILLGISRRAYGNEITSFLKELKSSRPSYRNELIDFTMPAINTGK